MFKIFLGLMAFAACIYIIGLVFAVIGTAFELIIQYWWVLAIAITLAIFIYFYREHKTRKKKEQHRKEALETYAIVEQYRLEAMERQAELDRQLDAAPSYCSSWLSIGGVDAELLNIDLMEGHKFEYWCADLLEKIGFSKVEVTQASGDDGVDILAEKDNVRYAIQCKRYNSHLGNTPIQEVHAGKAVYNCHVGAVMTNQYFTEGGQRVASATGTLLWDRDWIRDRIKEVQFAANEKLADPPFSAEELEGDEMFPVAVDVILETGQASVTQLQKQLHIGYSRASKLMDELEENGIVGPFQGSKPRSVLITKQEWDLKKKQ